jgi:hypothetical protein
MQIGWFLYQEAFCPAQLDSADGITKLSFAQPAPES